MRRTLIAAALATTLAISAASALAAGPKSGTYKGTFKGGAITISISLKLSGTMLGPATISNIPLYCQGGGPPLRFTFPKATISRTGAFTVHGANKIKVGPLKGKVGERLTLKGVFSSHGTVAGILTTSYPRAKSCGGTSRFSAKR